MNKVPFQEEYFYYPVEDAKDEKKPRSSWEINQMLILPYITSGELLVDKCNNPQ
jgi:hypothetical protein